MTADAPLQFESHGVSAVIVGDNGDRFEGAAVLRSRPHPLSGALLPQLGVPDAALGFRPSTGTRYHVAVDEPGGERRTFAATAVWLERVASSWWFILEL